MNIAKGLHITWDLDLFLEGHYNAIFGLKQCDSSTLVMLLNLEPSFLKKSVFFYYIVCYRQNIFTKTI